MAVTILFFCLTVKNSLGNVIEILDKLDKDKYTRVEITENYKVLKEKWGEWEFFGTESSVTTIKYIDVGNALFSGLMVTYSIFTLIFLSAAIIIGKITLPMLANMYKNSNDELIDITTLRTMEQVNEMSGKKEKNKKPKKEWF